MTKIETQSMNLNALLRPKSVAVLGASENKNSIGGRPIVYLQKYGFQGRLYPINPKYDTLHGLVCYSDIDELPEPVDLLLITIQAKYVMDSLKKAKRKGIKAVVIFSSGFAEIGEEGKKLQDEVARFAAMNEIIISGPNCQGFINHWDKAAVTFTGALQREIFKEGSVSFCSQSGAMGGMIYAMAQEMGLGFSFEVSSGNEAMIMTSHYIEYALNDEKTNVVTAYLEAINDVEALRRCTDLSMEKEKPIVLMKVGRSTAGSKAAASHTGALAGEDSIADTFFRQEGIIRVDTTDQLFDCMKVFSNPKRVKGNRVGIVSISGGAGVVMADACEAYGLEVVELEKKTEDNLRTLLPPFGSPKNPVDLTAQVLTESEKFYNCLQCVIADPGTDCIVIFIGLLEHLKESLIPAIIKIDAKTDKPVLVTWLACNDSIRKEFYAHNIPFFEDPSRCIYGVGQLNKFRKFIEAYKSGSSDRSTCYQRAKVNLEFINNKKGILDEITSKKILLEFDIPVSEDIMVTSPKDAVKAAQKIGFPVVLKIVSPDIAHKSDIGAVALNLQSPQEVIQAYHTIERNVKQKMPEARIEGLLVSEMVPSGKEMIVGIKNDPVFGPVIITGFGGIFVEVLKDVSCRVLPINGRDAREMLQELKYFPLLRGLRGEKPKDINALVNVLLRVSEMGMALKERISELDINPLIVFEEGRGVKAVDALLVLKS